MLKQVGMRMSRKTMTISLMINKTQKETMVTKIMTWEGKEISNEQDSILALNSNNKCRNNHNNNSNNNNKKVKQKN